MNKRQIEFLKQLTDCTYCRLGPSTTQGVGVFAIRDIPAGINPFAHPHEFDYVDFKLSDLKSLPEGIKKLIYDYCAPEDGVVYIPTVGFNVLELTQFINHSKTPNMKTIDDGTTFVSSRVIKQGEELFADYGTYSEKFQESFDWKSEKVFE